MRRAVLASLVAAALAGPQPGCDDMDRSAEPLLRQADVFVSGTEGYHTFRIPAAVVTPGGELLAFAEGRKAGQGDSGDVDLVLRRSLDGGETWQPLQVVWDDGANTCGNPCAVVDRDTRAVWLLMTHNLGQDTEAQILGGTAQGARTVWVTRSADDGATWDPPREITADVKKPDWTWYATGPGVGIQLTSGRLVVPCDHAVAGTKAMESHVLYSDDHGKTWRLGGSAGPATNECQVIERTDGMLLLNMRNYDPKHPNVRAVAASADGGLSWSGAWFDAALVEPVCQASLLRCPDAECGDRTLVLFSNPASPRRENLAVRLSRDEARTWPVARTLHPGPAAYSSLAVLADGTIACLYECGDRGPYERIALARFNLAWLTEGEHAPPGDAGKPPPADAK